MAQHKLSQVQVQKLIGALSAAYEHASDAPRYSAEVAGKQVTVIPSRGLGKEVHQIIEGAIHGPFLVPGCSFVRFYSPPGSVRP